MLLRPQIWLFGLSRHLWQGYDHIKTIQGHSSPRSPKNLPIIGSLYRYDRFLPWHVEKALWSSRPINCRKFPKRQIRLERWAQTVFWCYQTCDKTLSIVGLPRLQWSVWNTYWFFQTTNWRSNIPKGQFHRFLLQHQITVYTDHKHLTYKTLNTERVMRWRLILKECGPELKYIKGLSG